MLYPVAEAGAGGGAWGTSRKRGVSPGSMTVADVAFFVGFVVCEGNVALEIVLQRPHVVQEGHLSRELRGESLLFVELGEGFEGERDGLVLALLGDELEEGRAVLVVVFLQLRLPDAALRRVRGDRLRLTSGRRGI